MPLCNRMFCCIFGWYFYIEIRLKYERNILLSSSRAFSLSTPTFSLSIPVDNSEATWKKATKCNKQIALPSLSWINKVEHDFHVDFMFEHMAIEFTTSVPKTRVPTQNILWYLETNLPQWPKFPNLHLKIMRTFFRLHTAAGSLKTLKSIGGSFWPKYNTYQGRI